MHDELVGHNDGRRSFWGIKMKQFDCYKMQFTGKTWKYRQNYCEFDYLEHLKKLKCRGKRPLSAMPKACNYIVWSHHAGFAKSDEKLQISWLPWWIGLEPLVAAKCLEIVFVGKTGCKCILLVSASGFVIVKKFLRDYTSTSALKISEKGYNSCTIIIRMKICYDLCFIDIGVAITT